MGLASAILFSAIFADPVNLKSVAGSEVLIAAADFLLEVIDLGREELYGTTALGAHHVMMAAAIVLMLVTRDSVVEGNLAGQSTFRQQFQRAINGRVADAGILLLHQPV